MLFLIQYARDEGRLVSLTSFDDSEIESAEESRLALELECNVNGIDHEIVLLDAASEAALRRTHRRYFEDLRELTMAPLR